MEEDIVVDMEVVEVMVDMEEDIAVVIMVKDQLNLDTEEVMEEDTAMAEDTE